MRILGIETSCDETGAAIVEKGTRLISNSLASSIKLHAKTGGIIPETAAREQIKYIIPVISQVIKQANIDTSGLDAIAVTVGPGLIGSLLVGVETAKTLAYIWNKPIIPVNHLVGHIYANWIKCHPDLFEPEPQSRRPERSEGEGSHSQRKKIADQVRNDKKIKFPAIALIVSGGHTDLVLLKNHKQLRWLGGTRDDAAGEAFDKIARLLGLSYPGGPAIEKASKRGNASHFKFPRPMIDSNDFDFSFSGLKTAVMHNVILRRQPKNLMGSFAFAQDDIADLSASVQQAIVDVLVAKTLKAAKQFKVKSILLGGGVAANELLRETLEVSCRKLEVKLFAPAKSLCTDNAAMIASAAFFNYNPVPWQKTTANPELYFD